jgi:hypothetical protein
MDLQSILTDFLAYLYENNIDIRDEKISWQFITKDFIDRSGYSNMTRKQLKRVIKILEKYKNIKMHENEKLPDLSNDSSPMNTFARDNYEK